MSRYSRFGKPSHSKAVDRMVTQRLSVTPAAITGDYPSMVDDYQRRVIADPRYDTPVDVDNNTPWMGADGGTTFPHWHSGETYGLLHLMHGDTGLRAGGRKPDHSDVFTGDMEPAEKYGIDWTKFRYHTEARRHAFEAPMISGDNPIQITDVPTGTSVERDHIKFKLWSRNTFIPPGTMYAAGPSFSSVANIPDHLNHYITDRVDPSTMTEHSAGFTNNVYGTFSAPSNTKSPFETVDAGDGSLAETFTANPYEQISRSMDNVSPIKYQRATMEFAHSDACNTTSQAVIAENMRAAVEKAVESVENSTETYDGRGPAVAIRPDMLRKLISAQAMAEFQHASDASPTSQAAYRPDQGHMITSHFVGDANLDDANVAIAIGNGSMRKLIYSDPIKAQKMIASELAFNAPDQLTDANVRSISNEQFISLTKSNAGVQYHMNGESLNAYATSTPLIPMTQQLLQANAVTQAFNVGQLQSQRGIANIEIGNIAWNADGGSFINTVGAMAGVTATGARPVGTTGMTGGIADFAPTVETNAYGALPRADPHKNYDAMISDHIQRINV